MNRQFDYEHEGGWSHRYRKNIYRGLIFFVLYEKSNHISLSQLGDLKFGIMTVYILSIVRTRHENCVYRFKADSSSVKGCVK
jgi:hypothetical protein